LLKGDGMKKLGSAIKDFFGKFGKWISHHKRLSIFFAFILALLILTSALLINSRSKTSQVTYREVKITRGNITQTIDVVGNVKAIPSAVLAWQTTGVVGEMTVRVGDKVKAGDTVLKLQDNSLPASILDAKSNLLTAQLDLDKLRVGNPDLETATQTLADAQYDFTIKKVIRDYYIITGASDDKIAAGRKVYELANEAYLTAKNDHDALIDKAKNDPQKIQAAEKLRNASLKRDSAIIDLTRIIGNYWNYSLETVFNSYDTAKTTLAQAKITWEKLYNNKSAYLEASEAKVQALANTINSSRIIAPFSGTVTDVMTSAGESVSSGTEAVQLDDLTHLMIDVSVSEVDINKLAVGQQAEINFAAIPAKTYKGVITKIGNAGTSTSGVVQFGATIQVLDADEPVKPGFSATISIVIKQASNALLVPNLAITTNNDGKSYVFVSRNGKNQPMEIEVGLKSDTYTEILAGSLKEGDIVVIVISSGSADTANNRALFGIMGGFGGGGDRPPQNQPNPNSTNSNR
jgi:HlyD family secretion protein